MSQVLCQQHRVRKTRSRGLRTKTGCNTCRSRHVKCDEARPSCQACQKGNRACKYLNDDSSRSSVSHATSSSVDHNGNEPNSCHGIDAIQYNPIEPDPSEALHDAQAEARRSSMLTDSDQTWSNLNGTALDVTLQMTSPASTLSGSAPYSAEVAPLRWFNLLTKDGIDSNYTTALDPLLSDHHDVRSESLSHRSVHNDATLSTRERQDIINAARSQSISQLYHSSDSVKLSATETRLLRHFVENLSSWIDLTDPIRSFSVIVPLMALKNKGLMKAILALSSRHLSLQPVQPIAESFQWPSRTTAVQYYDETLRYLQLAMKNDAYLKSEELLATVLTISTYEMIDGFGGGWERHLKGVFWIQRSQLIHGESGGLKQAIWWAWLRQDLWAAFRERRRILSFYTLERSCAELNQWELINRAVYLLGQCVNFASDAERNAGNTDVQDRLERAKFLGTSLDEWYQLFSPYCKELPADCTDDSIFRPVWINPPSCSVAVQVYNFARLLLIVNQPAACGYKELLSTERKLNDAIDAICGIACTTTDSAAIIVSTQCLFAAGLNLRDPAKRAPLLKILRAHRNQTAWPADDLEEDLRAEWRNLDDP